MVSMLMTGPTLEQNHHKTYFPQLDGLRFFAFLLVFIHHAPIISQHPIWQSLHSYGWIGVDLFLCLSAFLFTRLLYTEYQRTGTINISYFYIRRTLRIWPLYYFFVIGMLLLTSLLQSDFQVPPLRFAGILTFTDNLVTAYTFQYSSLLFTTHLWTISYEEQFYAMIPWALRRLFEIGLRTRMMILGAAMAVGYVIRAIFIWMQVPHPAIWVLPITHFDAILLGLLIGLGAFDVILNKIPWQIIGLMGLMALIAVPSLPNVTLITWNLMLTYSLTGLGMALLLYTALRADTSPALRWLSSKPVAFLGKISYGLYVYHLFALWLPSQIVSVAPTNYWLWVAAGFVLPLLITIGLSSLSYLLLERPFLLLKDRFAVVQSRPA
jgi:peptidoglycan/LPS O-acetylase OafA/YrhL